MALVLKAALPLHCGLTTVGNRPEADFNIRKLDNFMSTRCLCLAALLFNFLGLARADEPLGPPERVITCSRSAAYCVESDPKTNRTNVFRRGNSTVLWSIAGWHRWLFVTDDGSSVVVCYEGLNLIPTDSPLNLEVLRFYKRAKLVRSVRLGDLYKSKSQLKRTVSHFAWVDSISINQANLLIVELIDERKAKFDLGTDEVKVVSENGD
jgi:hypothetical protein